MADLLSSSSDEEGDAVSTRVSTRSTSDGGSSILASSFGVTDRSQSETDLIDSLLTATPSLTEAAWKGNNRSVQATTSTYVKKSDDNGDVTLHGGANHVKKPLISAKDMLMKLFPASSQKTSTLMSPPTKIPSIATSTTNTRSTLDAAAARGDDSRRSSLSPTPSRLPSAGEASVALSKVERIALKYGLMRSQSPGANGERAATSSKHRASAEEEKGTRPTVADFAPVRSSAAEPKKAWGRSPFWDVDVRNEEQQMVASTTTYVSPFASKNGFIDAKRRRRLSGENGVRYHDLALEAVYDDSKREAAEIGNRPRHVIASSITSSLGKDSNGEDIDSDDGWISDAKDIAVEKQDERARAKLSSADTLKNRGKNALPLVKVQSKSLKRPRKHHPGSDDEVDHEDADCWPRLPPPEREGAQFLYDAYSKNTGAILGDEMGLGKTIQVIAFIAAILGKRGDLRDKESWRQLRSRRREVLAGVPLGKEDSVFDMVGGPRPILVVVPASLLHNWEAELRTWLCCCTVILHGKPDERDAIVKQIPRGEYEIVICSYDILKMTVHRLNNIPWETIIFDEMHCLKNPESKLTKAAQLMECAKKLGLTGTLMQNNEKELHCLFDTIAPGVLGNWTEFRAYYGDDIKYGRKKSAVAEAIERSRHKEKKLRQVLSPYYLRREKEINPRFQEIKKCDQVVFCDLTPYQLAAYKRILAMPEFELLRRGEEVCDCGRNSKRIRKQCCYQTPASISDARSLIWERFHDDGEACDFCPNCVTLVCVAQLLKLSNHMELLKVNPRDSPAMQEYSANFARVAFGKDTEEVGGVDQVVAFQKLRDIGTKTCGKMQVLEKLLALWKKRKQRTLLFSRSTRMLDILQNFLVTKATTYLRLDGNTKVDDRLRLVNEFNSPESNASVFLISTRAGGLGLNLPSATNVVIFDPSWNPAHDCQAQDRAYRIGQTKDVQVYRLITLGTIEEMIYVRQIYKQQLSDTTLKGVKAPRYFEGVQGDRKQQGELFGIRNLLCWKEGGVLKGIQDAYRRGNDGLLVQENEIDYTKAVQPKASSKQKMFKRQVDEEMVEVADEIVSNIVAPDGAGAESKEEAKSTATEVKPVDSESDDDGESQFLLSGATTFMHAAIVGDHQPNTLFDSDGEAEFGEPEQEVRSEMNSAKEKSPQPSAPVQKKLDYFNKAQQMVQTPKRTSIPSGEMKAKEKSVQQSVSLPSPPQKKSLYIPKYL